MCNLYVSGALGGQNTMLLPQGLKLQMDRSLCGCRELDWGHMQKYQVLSATEPPLQTQGVSLCCRLTLIAFGPSVLLNIILMHATSSLSAGKLCICYLLIKKK